MTLFDPMEWRPMERADIESLKEGDKVRLCSKAIFPGAVCTMKVTQHGSLGAYPDDHRLMGRKSFFGFAHPGGFEVPEQARALV